MTIHKLQHLALSVLIGLTITQTASSQITIGSTTAPNKGSLLDLRDGDYESTRGLGLPRVNLTSNSSLEPCLSPSQSADTKQRKKHIGLLVYNVGEEIETTAEDRLCQGLHIWDGNKWTSIIPYFNPDITRSGPKEKLTIVRGSGNSEVTTYTTAYFHGYSRVSADGTPTTGSVYVCDPSKLVEIDAGQWMTMNMRTEYLPDNTKLPRWNGTDSHPNPQCEVPDYPDANSGKYPIPLTEKEKELNGFLYNWAAATDRKDTYKELDSEFDIDHARVQGICPEGWHLPAIREWTELLYILRAQSYLFGTEATASSANTISLFSGGKSLSPEEGGTDFRMLGTRHRTSNTFPNSIIDGYMRAAYFWSSTAGPTERLPEHNNDWDKWNARGINVRLTASLTNIPTADSYRSRVLTESVRCKKD